MTPAPVILLPGSVMPAGPAYEALIAAVGSSREVVAQDLAVYDTEAPPDDYSLDHEVAKILRTADQAGWERFHLAGYSGGGSAALACAAADPDRLLSLALLEPAWAGDWDRGAGELALWAEYGALRDLPLAEFMARFVRLQVRDGVEPPPPPPGDPPPWMAKRPAGIAALLDTFDSYELSRDALARFSRPVYFALGGLSNPDQFQAIADRLQTVFTDFTLELFEQRHHFDPPHRVEPSKLAASLMALWTRAEA
jgi:pimeloyl-ACP methyl ester carboxylesterase